MFFKELQRLEIKVDEGEQFDSQEVLQALDKAISSNETKLHQYIYKMLNPNSRSTITLTWFKTVTKLHAGQSFGELALLKNDGRAATILCATKCSFATLHRKDYIWIIG